MKKTRQRSRQALDQRFSTIREAVDFARPKSGWVRTLREALGMTRIQLGKRMSITPQSLADIERSETEGKIRLETLERAADALDCEVVYFLLPRDRLEQRVMDRAREVAAKQIRAISHTMAMEDQAVSDKELKERIDRFIRESLDERDLWES